MCCFYGDLLNAWCNITVLLSPAMLRPDFTKHFKSKHRKTKSSVLETIPLLNKALDLHKPDADKCKNSLFTKIG